MRRAFLLGSALVALTACGGVPWRVVDQAPGDPFRGQKRFLLARFDFSRLGVGDKTEGEYLSEKYPDERMLWTAAKVGLIEEFTKSLRAASASTGIEVSVDDDTAPFIIQPHVEWIEPGFFIVFPMPSTVKMTVSILDPRGVQLDAFYISHSTSSRAPGPNTIVIDWSAGSTIGRLRSDGEELGVMAARYLIARVFPRE